MGFLEFVTGPVCSYATKSTLTLLWIATYIHIYRGSKYRALMILTALLALYQVFNMIGFYFIFAIEVHNHPATFTYIVLNDVFVGTAYALFNVVHFELAWIYRGIAKTTPLVLNDEKMP